MKMNQEEAKKYLFERIPALVQCNPESEWAYLFSDDKGYYWVSDENNFGDGEDDSICSIKIPYDENGELALEALFWDGIDRQRCSHLYRGMQGNKYLSNKLSWDNMTPIYPTEAPKTVDFTYEDLKDVSWVKSKINGMEYLIAARCPEQKTFKFLDGYKSVDVIIKNYTQTDGTPFTKEVK